MGGESPAEKTSPALRARKKRKKKRVLWKKIYI
jgi:hypothetical protein